MAVIDVCKSNFIDLLGNYPEEYREGKFYEIINFKGVKKSISHIRRQIFKCRLLFWARIGSWTKFIHTFAP